MTLKDVMGEEAYRLLMLRGLGLIPCSHWGLFPYAPGATYQRLNFGPELP
jgi:hypothetical protein